MLIRDHILNSLICIWLSPSPPSPAKKILINTIWKFSVFNSVLHFFSWNDVKFDSTVFMHLTQVIVIRPVISVNLF